MKTLTWVAERLLNVPLLIESGRLAVLEYVLAPRLGVERGEVPEHGLQQTDKREIYSVTASGIAVVDIAGTLVNRMASGIEAQSGMTSYEEIASELDQAESDPKVKGAILRIDSGGGEAQGTSALAERIARFGQSKPIFASVDANAFSAAYWIASATDRIYVPVDGGVGSIGAIARHVDRSKMNEAMGVKVTTIKSAARKAEISQDEPLTDEARARVQELVDEMGGRFVDAVAANRKMAKRAVRATDGLTIYGQKAIDDGFADKIGSFQDALSEMESMLARGGKREAPAVITQKKSEQSTETRPVETRCLPTLELRAADATEEPLITGHIAVFNSWSLDVGGFREIIMPGAFVKTITESDIHHFFNHHGDVVLGRNKSGTLRLKEDSIGLAIENDPPNTQTVRDLVLEPIRRGDIDQGSFAFVPVRQEWGRSEGKLTRTLHELRVFHTAIVPQGAYPTTDVALREAATRALASAVGLDFFALAECLAKCKYNLDLSLEDRSLLKEASRYLTLETPVTPGHAAHLTESGAKPPNLTALRQRLELERRRYAS